MKVNEQSIKTMKHQTLALIVAAGVAGIALVCGQKADSMQLVDVTCVPETERVSYCEMSYQHNGEVIDDWYIDWATFDHYDENPGL